MKFYNEQHEYYCGIDLHAKTMYVCIVDKVGKVLCHKNVPANKEALLRVIAPYRENLAIAVECMFCWYWLADVCAAEGITFVLGHALYMKAIHGGKAANDRIDSEKIAMLLKSGMLPKAFVYPAQQRGARDLMRRRLFFVHRRSELLAHVQMTFQQYNLPPPTTDLVHHKSRNELDIPFSDEAVARMVKTDLATIGHLTTQIHNLESFVTSQVKLKGEIGFNIALLRSVPGIGPVLSATIFYEIHDITRFPSVQDFVSYCRLIKPQKTSAGKSKGGSVRGSAKIGNHHLRWAFAEAAVLSLRTAEGKRMYEALCRKHPKPKALAVLAHKIARIVYFILLRRIPWEAEKFYANAA